MKIAQKLTVVSLALSVAGCSSWRERHAQNYDNYRYSSANYGAYGNAGGSSTSSTVGSTGAGTTSSAAQPGIQSFQPGTSSSSSQTTSSSGDVTSQVQQQLRQDPTLATLVPSLQITAQSGTVTLSGTVPSEQDKQKIETIAKSATGVVNVNNQLQVLSQSQFNQPGTTENKPAVGGTSDQSTTSQSTGNQSSQENAPQTPPQSSTTSPQSSTTDKSSAEQAALAQSSQDSTIAGTSQSQELSPTSDRTGSSRVYGTNQGFPTFTASTDADRTLGQQVVQELKTDTTMAALLPTVKMSIDNGKVTLKGTVKSEDQKKKIESAVQRVTGVSNVDDQLQVSAGSAETGTNPISQ